MLPVFWPWDNEGVFGQRDGGSGEQLKGTRGPPRLGVTYCCGTGRGGAGPTPQQVEGLGPGWALGRAGQSEAGRKMQDRVPCSGRDKAPGLSVHLSSPRNHCCFSDLRGRNLRGPVAFLVATAAVKPTRQHRDMVLNLSVSSQLGEAACRY